MTGNSNNNNHDGVTLNDALPASTTNTGNPEPDAATPPVTEEEDQEDQDHEQATVETDAWQGGRTFASNSNDPDAGTASNPLKIDLDD